MRQEGFREEAEGRNASGEGFRGAGRRQGDLGVLAQGPPDLQIVLVWEGPTGQENHCDSLTKEYCLCIVLWSDACLIVLTLCSSHDIA